MAEKIEIAEFSIDIEALTNAAAQTQKAIQEIRNEQKQLVKDGKGADEAFVRNAVNLRGLQKDYNAQLKVLDQYINASGKQISIQQQVDIALSREATTIEQLRAQNSELTKIRNQVNIETEEGQKQLAALNAQLDQNNALIKENVSDREQQVMSVGGYTDAIKEAFQNTGLFGGALTDIKSAMATMSPIFSDITNQLRNISDGFTSGVKATKDMSTAQKAAALTTNAVSTALKLLRVALIATGIGAIVVVLGSLVAYLTQTQEGIDKVNRVLVPLKQAFSELLGILGDLGKALFDAFSNPLDTMKQLYNFVKGNLIDQFQAFGKILEGIFTLNFDLMKQGFTDLGDNIKGNIDGIANAFGSVVDRMGQAIDRGKEIQQIQEQIEQAEIEMISLQAETERQLQQLTLIRRDASKSDEERRAAIQEQHRLTANLVKEEEKILDLKVRQKELEVETGATTRADLKELAELRAERDNIELKNNAIRLETIERENNLRRSGEARAKKAQEDYIKRQNDLLELYIAEQGIRAQTLEQELEMEREVSNRKRDILDQELAAKKISQEKYNAEVLKLNNDLLKRQAEISVENAQRELNAVDDRIAIERAVSQAVGIARVQEEQERFKELQAERARFEQIRFEQGIIDENEYADAVAVIRRDGVIREAEFERQMRDARNKERLDQMELDFETEMNALEAQTEERFALEELRIEQQRERDLETARQRYTDEAMLAQAIMNINAAADNSILKMEQEKNNAVLQARAGLAGAISQLVGEETALGKAAALAQATISTYVAANEALKAGPIIGPILAATTIAQGLTNVGKITGIGSNVGSVSVPESSGAEAMEIGAGVLNAVPPFAKGGIVKKGMGYPIRRNNGDNILATVRTGEVFLNKEQQAALGGDAVFRAIGVPGFAGGGLVGSSSTTVQSALFAGMENQLADTIGKAVQQGARAGTEVGSRQGIFDLSTERYLRDLSSL